MSFDIFRFFQTNGFLFALGLSVGGIGLTLMFQGLAIKNPKNKKAGSWAYGIGIFWALAGLLYMFCSVLLYYFPVNTST
jgi:hypothetical protein